MSRKQNDTTSTNETYFGVLADGEKLSKRQRSMLRRDWRDDVSPIAHTLRDRWHNTPLPITLWQRVGAKYTPCDAPAADRFARVYEACDANATANAIAALAAAKQAKRDAAKAKRDAAKPAANVDEAPLMLVASGADDNGAPLSDDTSLMA